MTRARILMADDHTLVLEGFKRLLEPDYEVVGMVTDGRALIEAAEKLQPDVVLVDISMPLLNGVDAVRRLKKAAPRVKILFVTMHADPAYVSEAFRAGASGYLLKRSAGSELLTALSEILKGRSYVTPLVTREFLEARGQAPPRSLSPRQREVVQLIAEGLSMKEIAGILHVSVKTVEFHKARSMQQLGIQTNADLIKYAISKGLVSL